jgi:hypothetical protein
MVISANLHTLNAAIISDKIGRLLVDDVVHLVI